MLTPIPTRLVALCNTLYPNLDISAWILPIEKMATISPALEQWLHTDELTQLSSYTFEKRQREWLAGRICSKKALQHFLQSNSTTTPPSHASAKVGSKESGQPFFKQIDSVPPPFPRLSITHSHGYAAALVTTVHCGIDIQLPADNLHRVKDHFCTAEEERQLQQSLPEQDKITQLTLLWAGKEALKKMLSHQGMPGFLALQLQRISCTDQNNTILTFCKSGNNQSSFPVATTILNSGYGLAISCLQQSPQTLPTSIT